MSSVEKGAIHFALLVITLAILGIIFYLLLTTYAPFTSYVSQSIYKTPDSHAANK